MTSSSRRPDPSTRRRPCTARTASTIPLGLVGTVESANRPLELPIPCRPGGKPTAVRFVRLNPLIAVPVECTRNGERDVVGERYRQFQHDSCRESVEDQLPREEASQCVARAFKVQLPCADLLHDRYQRRPIRVLQRPQHAMLDPLPPETSEAGDFRQ